MQSINLIKQGAFVALFLAGLVAVGATNTAGLACALLLAAAGLILFTNHRATLGSDDRAWHIALAMLVWPAAVGGALALTQLTGTFDVADDRRMTVEAIFLLVIGGFAALWLSTLIDLLYVRPTMRGSGSGIGKMPCQSSLDPSWRAVTRHWLANRLAAQLSFVLCGVVAVGVAAAEWLSLDETVGGAIAAAATVVAGFYLTRARAVVAFSVHPVVHVGDCIVLAEEFQPPAEAPGAEYYVADVSFEGINLLALPVEAGSTEIVANRGLDRRLDIGDAAKLLRRRRAYTGCAEVCQRVNPACELKLRVPSGASSTS